VGQHRSEKGLAPHLLDLTIPGNLLAALSLRLCARSISQQAGHEYSSRKDAKTQRKAAKKSHSKMTFRNFSQRLATGKLRNQGDRPTARRQSSSTLFDNRARLILFSFEYASSTTA
jgi:hypothetical protein